MDNSESKTDIKQISNSVVAKPETSLQEKKFELENLEQSLLKKEEKLLLQEQSLKSIQEDISKQKAELNTKLFDLEGLQLQAKNGFPKLFEEKFSAVKKQLEEREENCANEFKFLEAEKEKLRQRELEVKKSEIRRDNGFSENRAKLEEEMHNLRKKQENSLALKRQHALEEIEKLVSNERASKLSDLERNLADRLKIHETSIQADLDDIEQKKITLRKEKVILEDLKDELLFQKERIQSGKDTLEEREQNLDDQVEAKIAERKKSFEVEVAVLKEEITRLQSSVRTSSSLISSFEELKHKLGGEDPASVLLKLKTYEKDIKSLREDLASRPTIEMHDAFDRLKQQNEELEHISERLAQENHSLRDSASVNSDLAMQLDELVDKNKSLVRRYEAVEADNIRLEEELKRLKSSYEREQEREDRIRDIEKPYLPVRLECNNLHSLDAKRYGILNYIKGLGERELSDQEKTELQQLQHVGDYEIQWLDQISESCMDYGLKFPRRILHAFHTALKTSEWSPITVLAGVSGTGKSELPRLYSHFGGINFLSLSVQPNWDSQESMLGFFNSIDNKFDSQPVLRFLAQSQKDDSEDYPGLKDTVNLILMDEMNLAYVELYFAEFLSKLELRRGSKGDSVPSLDVKLGAGVSHYELPLGRNVLWAGTMNQDETTKSLSDKVLDRGIVINFPRPTKLKSRPKLKPLPDQADLLSRQVWESWWCKASTFTENQIEPFKTLIEEMNEHLSKVGRALGHRVWQSIEYYMANYPDVLAAQRDQDDIALKKAMKTAFEDQLVQKVMPKLRGIETRGRSKTECLDQIRSQLVNTDYSIVDDFDLACSDLGYGQFIWNSANYLKEEYEEDNNKNSDSSTNIDDEIKLLENEVVKQHDNEIPDELFEYAENEGIELYSLSTIDIKRIIDCSAKEAQRLKGLVNDTKA